MPILNFLILHEFADEHGYPSTVSEEKSAAELVTGAVSGTNHQRVDASTRPVKAKSVDSSDAIPAWKYQDRVLEAKIQYLREKATIVKKLETE